MFRTCSGFAAVVSGLLMVAFLVVGPALADDRPASLDERQGRDPVMEWVLAQ